LANCPKINPQILLKRLFLCPFVPCGFFLPRIGVHLRSSAVRFPSLRYFVMRYFCPSCLGGFDLCSNPQCSKKHSPHTTRHSPLKNFEKIFAAHPLTQPTLRPTRQKLNRKAKIFPLKPNKNLIQWTKKHETQAKGEKPMAKTNNPTKRPKPAAYPPGCRTAYPTGCPPRCSTAGPINRESPKSCLKMSLRAENDGNRPQDERNLSFCARL